jgi:thioredoxin reductase
VGKVEKDVSIIGGGPTGLFAAFYAGMRGASVRIIDSLPQLGGQLMALYPEKYIYDVGGFPKIQARELAEACIEQAMRFEPDTVLDEEIREIRREGNGFLLVGRDAAFPTKTVVLAGGKGAFEPTRLECPGYDELLGKGVHFAVKSPEEYHGKRVVIVGGGDSALDWAVVLKDLASSLVIVHRREAFRAHERTVAEVTAARERGEVEIRTPCHLGEIAGEGKVERVTVVDLKTGAEETIGADAVLTFLGFKPDLGPIAEWGLELDGSRVAVNHRMETNIPGIFAAGDIAGYEGKLDLIASGFSEAALAANHAVHYLNPDARVNPGHSSHMKLFKE